MQINHNVKLLQLFKHTSVCQSVLSIHYPAVSSAHGQTKLGGNLENILQSVQFIVLRKNIISKDNKCHCSLTGI